MRILVVEDHPLLRESIVRALRAEGHSVDGERTARAARDAVEHTGFGLVVLDRGLPDGEGLELLREWRSGGVNTPVLVLTAQVAVSQRVEGLEAGADDYLTKPFEMSELIARVRAIGRRSGEIRDVVLRSGGVELNTARAEVRRDGVLLPLRAKEFAVLQLLMERRGRVVSRDQLRSECWDDDAEIGSNVEEATMSALRRKLGAPSVIQTRRGLGYVIDD